MTQAAKDPRAVWTSRQSCKFWKTGRFDFTIIRHMVLKNRVLPIYSSLTAKLGVKLCAKLKAVHRTQFK